jgi:hypothetical protein
MVAALRVAGDKEGEGSKAMATATRVVGEQQQWQQRGQWQWKQGCQVSNGNSKDDGNGDSDEGGRQQRG